MKDAAWNKGILEGLNIALAITTHQLKVAILAKDSLSIELLSKVNEEIQESINIEKHNLDIMFKR